MIKFLKPPRTNVRTSTGLLIVRLVAGLAFMFHGWGKIQNPTGWMGAETPVPGFLQALAALAEFGGGFCWIIGLLMPVASLGLACTMLVAAMTHAFMMRDPFVATGPGQGSYEPATMYLTISILFLLAGPGRYSVDRFLFGERIPPRTDEIRPL